MMVLAFNFFRIFEKKNWFIVAIFDLIHNVEAIYYLTEVLTAFRNLF